MITISLCMIVKNESNVLKRCLESVSSLVDEMIIVDTGSTDNTKDIAASFGAKIYDYRWDDDFAAARNYAFSKAKMDYIYSVDADEVLDSLNQNRFLDLKHTLLPDVEIVRMLYVTPEEVNTASGLSREYRTKLFKRLRTFSWIDPVHETIRIEPVVIDSDVEILHLPVSNHSQRDFSIFRKYFWENCTLSPTLHSTLAKELYHIGEDSDFTDFADIFRSTLNAVDSSDEMKLEAACVLAKTYLLQNDITSFLSLALKFAHVTPPSELCAALGNFYFSQKDYKEAIRWFECAAYQTKPIIAAAYGGAIAYHGLAKCYHARADKLKDAGSDDIARIERYLNMAKTNEELERNWVTPGK